MQEQKRENVKQRRVIEELASRKKQEKQDTETARNKETLKSGGLKKTKKKKTSPRKQSFEFEVDSDDIETCKILKHKTDKQGEVGLKVKWDDSGKTNWQNLYDMWADYPGEVKEYKKKNKWKGKSWKVPNIDDVTHFVRVEGMVGGDEEVTESKFIVLANNRYKFEGDDCVKYNELQNDDPELMKEFLDSVENSPEADDASIA